MPFDLQKNTIGQFHNEVVRRYRERPFLFYVDDEPITYGDYGKKVENLRILMASSGLKKADPVIILGPASPHWAIAFMAVMTAGYVAVPVMEDFPKGDIDHIVEDSGAVAAVLSKNYSNNEALPSLRGLLHFSMEDLCLLEEHSLTGGKPERAESSPFTEVAHPFSLEADALGCYPVEPSDVAELLYTSGTTGHSKAVMLSHNNLVTNLYEGTDLIHDCFDEQSILLSLLPMAHAFGSTSAFLSTMYKGPRICFLKRKPTPEYLQAVFRKVHPTVLGGVPLIFEKIYQKKILPLLQRKRLLHWAVRHLAPVRKFFHRAVGRSVLKYFGGQLKCIIIGGANFSRQVETFMREGKIPYVLGYGLSETSPLLTFSSLGNSRFGSVGHAVRHTEIRIASPDKSNVGDIEVRGPQIMKGYYKMPKETEEAFSEDGWFKTGDRGFLDKDGFLYIRGRSKNVIVGSSGENIYPEVIENVLGADALVEESIVYMDGQILKALVYPDQEFIKGRFKGSLKALEEALESLRREVNSRLPLNSRIGEICIHNEAFEKTATKKIKRARYVPGY